MAQARSYTIVDTNQTSFYDDYSETAEPGAGMAFSGQDAAYDGNQPAYVDNGNGTATDLNTSLTWTTFDTGDMTWSEAMAYADSLVFGGYDDWRLPTVKELYSLMEFSGDNTSDADTSIPYIDTGIFDFQYGDTAAGERDIDAQYWTSTVYVGTTMSGNATAFGVNFADGRIKGYDLETKTASVFLVRGNDSYGENDFVDNGDGTITDQATGLMWSQDDSGYGMDWRNALSYAESATLAGYADWYLPNAKELQSIVNYDQAPDATDPANAGPAIDDDYFTLTDLGGDYGYYWSSTTHVQDGSGTFAVYLSFGTAWGEMNGVVMDVHGAGSQRSDPKVDNGTWPDFLGPQGDYLSTDNYVLIARQVADDMTVSGGTGADWLAGDSGSDVIAAGAEADVVLAESGGDTVAGGDGGDFIDGGAGPDVIYGEGGNDSIDAAEGDDIVDCGDGDDLVVAGNYADIVLGGAGTDVIYGNSGSDRLYGNSGTDVLFGGADSDVLYGGQGGDYLSGDRGVDYLLGDLGNDTLSGGDDADYFFFAANGGADSILDFSGAAGDRIVVFSGATVSTYLDAAGAVVIDFGSSTSVTLSGVGSFSSDWFIYQ